MGRVKPIHIYGPVGLKQIIQLQLEVAKGKLAFDLVFQEIEPEQNSVLFEDEKVKVSCFPIVHKIPTSGFKIEEKPRNRKLLASKAKEDGIKIEHYHKLKAGQDVNDDGKIISFEKYTTTPEIPKSYAYCSDTAFAESTVGYVRQVTVLYHEATFIEKLRDRAEATKHSTAQDAAKVAKEAEVGTLLMGHISARYDSGEEHTKEASVIFENARCVEDGQIIEVK